MPAWKCAQCMLVNRETDGACRRCGAGPGSAAAATNTPSPVPGASATSPINDSVRVPAYGLPAGWQPVQQVPNEQGALRFGQTGNFQTGSVSATGIWRDGELLVMHRGATLPNRCLRCNVAANGPVLTCKLRWHDRRFSVLRFIPFLAWIYLIHVLATARSARLALHLCQDHYRQTKTIACVGWVVLLGGMALLGYGLYLNNFLWFIGFIIALVSGRFRPSNTIVRAEKMDDHYIWLRGVDDGYLASLPAVSG